MHLALIFGVDDSLDDTPPTTEDCRVKPGAPAMRGERAKLIASLDSLIRTPSNPLLRCLVERVEDGMGQGAAARGPVRQGARDRQ